MNRVLQGFAVGATTLALATSVCVPTGIYSFSCGASKAYAAEASQGSLADGDYTVSGVACDTSALKLEEGAKLSSPTMTISGDDVTLTFTTGTYAVDRITLTSPEGITSETKGAKGTPRYATKEIAAEKAELAKGDKTYEPVFAKGEVAGATFTITITKAQLAEALEGSAADATGLRLVAHYSSEYEKAELAGAWDKAHPIHLAIASVERIATDDDGATPDEPEAPAQESAAAEGFAASSDADAQSDEGQEGESGDASDEGTGQPGDSQSEGSGEQLGEGAGEGTGEQPGQGGGEGAGEGEGEEQPAEPAATLDEAKAMIEALPGVLDVTAADKDAIEAAQKAFDGLSAEDQATLKTTSPDPDIRLTTQPYARLLESAAWGLSALDAVDNSTTLLDGTYTSVSNPALSQSSGKGASTSSRQRTWSIQELSVADGKATATITVNSPSYDYISVGGQKYANSAAEGANSTFADVPVNLNEPLYFGAYSSSMGTGIAYQIITTIAEPTPAERVKQLIAALPTNPFDYTEDYADAVDQATEEFEALSEEEQQEVTDAIPGDGNEQTYGRLLEVAQWSMTSLEDVDDSTTLADGTYSDASQMKSKSDMGLSTSARQRSWTCEGITVKGGKATARISWDGNTPLEELHVGGKVYQNLSTTGGTAFEIPIDLNGDMYFSAIFQGATEETDAIAYHFVVEIDEATATPDAPKETDDPTPAPEDPTPGDNQGEGTNTGGTDNKPAVTPAPTNANGTSGGTVKPSTTTTKTTTTRATTRATTRSTATASRGTVSRTATTRAATAATAKATVPGSNDAASGVAQAQASLNRDLRAATAGNLGTDMVLYKADAPDRTPLAVLLSLLAAAGAGAAAFLTRFFRAER